MSFSLSYEDKKRAVLLVIVAVVVAWVGIDAASGGAEHWQRVIARLPLLLTGSGSGWPVEGGFALNILLSIASMALATLIGLILGLSTLARSAIIRLPALAVMNFLRNSPWLVLLFAMLYILPFEMRIFGLSIPFPPFIKAVIGLALPTGANLSEVIRGAVQSIHSGQWEAARSLGYTTGQIYRYVIMPQALRRMIPGWMNLYALLMIATALATVTGIQDVLTILSTSLAMESERVIVYFYLTILFLFFAYCYPIAVFARRLERAVKGDNL
ncbi:amino acid ABC transporter permease [Rhizobium sp. S95]|uniref:Amino acid ABC transporter permease n=1 Tax=Ciceribacter sichuanensis TaxID=2949647 RepID=A0AAJ1C1I6_9HYPH|nr:MULTISPECIES: amino acid ABC transporter permease [unclassified Ciceribacter]MCM2397247.1 amino acid ABC transporter permease [Ciceribacter sp. S95]MCO5959103.1 amino acid ABC transporter permease [Ciceribacter sp. S101]